MDAIFPNSRRIVILIPTFNDWPSVVLLLGEIDALASVRSRHTTILLMDDASTDPIPAELLSISPEGVSAIDVVRLRRNLGHQRAIAVGLAYLDRERKFDAVLVMDGDGEDSPSDIPRLLERFDELGGSSIVFAQRARRAEGIVFRTFYHLYRAFHRVLTGISVRVGNFSILPVESVNSLVVVSDLWNHFSASIFKARLPFVMIPTSRRRRLAGASKMNFTSLIVHGLSAISVFGEKVGVRGIVFASGFFLVTLGALLVTIFLRALTEQPIPQWASFSGGILLLVALQLLIGVSIFSLIVLAGRDSSSFLPSRDHAFFIRDVTSVWNAQERRTSSIRGDDG